MGKRLGGRAKGTPNKVTATVSEILERLKLNPIEGMAHIAQNRVECGVCRGEGKTRYKLGEFEHTPECWAELRKQGAKKPKEYGHAPCGCEHIGIRTCQSCYGTLHESISPDLRGRMYAELSKYLHPQLKAIEVSGAEGGPIDQSITVTFKDA